MPGAVFVHCKKKLLLGFYLEFVFASYFVYFIIYHYFFSKSLSVFSQKFKYIINLVPLPKHILPISMYSLLKPCSSCSWLSWRLLGTGTRNSDFPCSAVVWSSWILPVMIYSLRTQVLSPTDPSENPHFSEELVGDTTWVLKCLKAPLFYFHS